MPQQTMCRAQNGYLDQRLVGRSNKFLLAVVFTLGFTFGLQKAWGAPGDHVHMPPDAEDLIAIGIDDSYYWAAVDTVMEVEVALISPEDVDYIGGALVSDNYVDSYWDGGTKGSFSNPIHATHNWWKATDTGYTTIKVTLRDKTDNAETDDVNPDETLANTVGGFQLDSATARQLYGGNPTSSRVTVEGSGNGTLFICASNTYELSATTTPSTGAFRVWIRYNHVPNGTPVTGTFSGANPVFGPVGSGETQSNYVGIDVDRNSVLDQSEESIIIAVTRASLTGGVIKDKRYAPAEIEESYFPVVAGEDMEVGGSFNFKLEGANVNDDSLIRWFITDTSASGSEATFPYTWSAGETGYHEVTFYLDCNADGQYNAASESFITSPTFYVQNKKVTTWNTVYSSEIAAPTPAQVSAYYARAANLGLKRDHADDFRALVQFNLGTLTGPGTGPDPVTTSNDDEWFDQEHDVTLVEELDALGRTSFGKIILDWDDCADDTFIHEVGHYEWLLHNNDDTRNIMHWNASGTNRLTEYEANRFND